MSKHILGLDLSLSNTGVAIIDKKSRLRGWRSIKTDPSDGTKIERIDYIAELILEQVELYNPHLIIIENYAFSRRTAIADLAELGGIVKRELWRFTGVPECWMLMAPSHCKKEFTGKGTASKDEMIAAAQPWFDAYSLGQPTDIDRLNDNVCDALALAEVGRREYGDQI